MGRKRFLWHSSSSSRRPLAQRRPNAVAPPASSSSPAELAMSNGRELGEERVSGGLLGMGCVRSCARRGFYRPGSRGRGWPEGGRCGGPGDVRRATPGAAALRACWWGSVLASGHCGQALARPRRSAACREKRDGEGGSGRRLSSPSMSHGLGRGRGGWARPQRTPRAWLQDQEEREQGWLL
jgi:hypothetical protein